MSFINTFNNKTEAGTGTIAKVFTTTIKHSAQSRDVTGDTVVRATKATLVYQPMFRVEKTCQIVAEFSEHEDAISPQVYSQIHSV